MNKTIIITAAMPVLISLDIFKIRLFTEQYYKIITANLDELFEIYSSVQLTGTTFPSLKPMIKADG